MIINEDILEVEFTKFVDFIQKESGEKFEAFITSKYLNEQENYKYKVHEEAKANLANKLWKPEDIGTGKIQQRVSSAIKARVNYNGEMVDNNLVNWRQKDSFSKKPNNEKLESTLFNFYKTKIKDSEAFEQLMSEGLSYQFIAYLFFIKDSQKFLPISQERFDKIFKQIGLSDFKTSGYASWENYSEFCSIIKQVQKFLKLKDKNATLLDAHSFLWILGNQIQAIKQLPNDTHEKTKAITEKLAENLPVSNTTKLVEAVQKTGPLSDGKYTDELPPPLTVEQLKQAFKSLENDPSKKVQNGFLMLKAHYRSPERKISAERLAKAAGYPNYNIGNEQYGSFAHQICDLLDYQPEMWGDGEGGWTNALCTVSGDKDQQGHFQWILRTEVAEALEQLGLVEKTDYPDAITDIANAASIIEPLTEKERDAYIKARIGQGVFRERLIKYWGACSVTGCEELDILIASHIKPWRDCPTHHEAINMTNGLLLIPNLDSLFDKGFISFNSDGAILLSPQLSYTVADQLGVKKTMRLRKIIPQHQPYLELHRDKYFRKTS